MTGVGHMVVHANKERTGGNPIKKFVLREDYISLQFFENTFFQLRLKYKILKIKIELLNYQEFITSIDFLKI